MAKVWMEGINVPAMEKFLADLRSGEYDQGRMALVDDGKFCCLGVMCVSVPDEIAELDDSGMFRSGDRLYTSLPAMEVAYYLGIPEENLKKVSVTLNDVNILLVKHEGEHNEPDAQDGMIWATTLNDLYRKSFDEIADRFEETFMVDTEE